MPKLNEVKQNYIWIDWSKLLKFLILIQPNYYQTRNWLSSDNEIGDNNKGLNFGTNKYDCSVEFAKEIEKLQSIIEQKDILLAEKDQRIAEKEQHIQRLDKMIQFLENQNNKSQS